MHRQVALAARLVLLCLLWLALMFAARQVRQEWRVLETEAGRTGNFFDQDGDLVVTPDKLPPRAALSLALEMARTSPTLVDVDLREAQLVQTERLLARARRARPRWGEAETVAAYISLLHHGPNDHRTLDAFGRSLRFAPYLRAASTWRIRFGAEHWARLDSEAQHHVIDEARWVSHNAGSDALLVKALLGTGAAARAFRLQEAEARKAPRRSES